MYINSDINRELYHSLMKALKEENMRYYNFIMKSLNCRIAQVFDELRHRKICYLIKSLINYMRRKPVKRNIELEDSNYFSNDCIAVYSCITGKYDYVREPVFIPDNCEYYMISDRPLKKDSKWKYIDINSILPDSNLSKKDKNRYVKMHPEKIFSKYKYSVYLDGNIRPVTDLTEFINRISDYGIATFKHPHNDCVYKEGRNCIVSKKASRSEIKEHMKYLKRQGMPAHFGLADCGLIAREHNNIKCKKLMDEWWEQYRRHSKRDQISFAFIMFQNGIKMDDITVLGNNMYSNYAIRRLPHFIHE